MQTRDVRVIFETQQHRIVGTLQLPREGYRSRVTDFLNATEREFVAVTDVEVSALTGGTRDRRPFVALSVRHIVLAMEADVPSD